MKKVRLGVVGCGVICQYHLAAAKASPLIEIAAVADIVADKARSTAETFGVPDWQMDAAALIGRPDLDAILFAMATEGRTDLALMALRTGKHILVEKPCGANAAEVKALIAAQGDRVAASCSSRFRFSESSRVATDLLAKGAIGPLRTIHCRVHVAAPPRPEAYPPAWRLCKRLNGGGILLNWGCYDLDFLLGLAGWQVKPKKVFAKTWNIPKTIADHVLPLSDAETHYCALVTCEDGLAINLERSEYAPTKGEARWHFIGERGSLELQMNNHASGGKSKTIRLDTLDPDRGTGSAEVWEGEDVDNVHAGPILDFASAIVNGHRPRTSLADYLLIHRIFDGIYASAESGDVAEIP
jgi:predicted dehydrogenase